ncbi:MipA/OmpV family protein [Pseudoalteromonas sp. KG3]|jgi:outer membrane protein|uniref:MipA/OmpV family protein n=1 Tax=Pseudoalteromonas prydzensis TaxID=182141 RepID=A0ABR9FL54_9GAMM|nr:MULTISPECIES: MipA/OmpV family protein [Pseudoalteromonas]MBE0457529.1 MipA/OmpV family protein [Pseudoalteromonas prydzensis]WKD26134.1 MipA/OmpV family protein [Pseudoalteromonas sp. KG3]
MPWLVLLLCLFSSMSSAASKLEIGGGVFIADIPHYLGSDQSEQYIMPVPYIRYQSDDLDVDRNSFTGYLWHNESLHLDISAGVSLAVDSEENQAREGMDDLDWVFELGPSLNYYFIGAPKTAKQFSIGLFTRKAMATDFSSVTNAGWRYGPSIYFESPLIVSSGYEVTTSVRANANFADHRYLDYYYGISALDSRNERSQFNTQSGYSGADLSIGLNFDSKKYWLGGFIKYHHLAQSKQQRSPLVKQDSNISFGFGVAWKFYTQQGK